MAFGVAHLNAAAGVCVTASHNPKQYNGYKVYWGNGCQIIPPHDAGIAAAIDANLTPWPELKLLDVNEHDDGAVVGVEASSSVVVDAAGAGAGAGADADAGADDDVIFKHPLVTDPTASVADAYFATVKSALCNYEGQCAGSKPVAYTPLHGVGAPYVERMFREFNLPAFVPVASQMKPDPEFSTVVFPNPEEGRATWAESFAAASAAGQGSSRGPFLFTHTHTHTHTYVPCLFIRTLLYKLDQLQVEPQPRYMVHVNGELYAYTVSQTLVYRVLYDQTVTNE